MTAKASDDSAPNEAITSRKRQDGGIVAWPEDERPRERLLAHGLIGI